MAVSATLKYGAGVNIPSFTPSGGRAIIDPPSFSAFAGVKAPIQGNLTLEIKKECNGEAEICLSGSIAAQPFAGAEIAGSVGISKGGLTLTTAINGRLGVQGNMGATFSGCTDSGFSASTNADFGFVAELTGTVTGPGGLKENVTFNGNSGPAAGSRGVRGHGPQVDTLDFSSVFPTDEEYLSQPEIQAIIGQSAAGGTCAKVRIRIDQDVIMTRTTTRATLELANETMDGAISQIGFDFDIRDIDGNPANDLFNIQVTKLTGLDAIDGTGSIPAESAGSAQWTLIPRDTAALLEPKEYTVGGTISYILNSTEFNIPVESLPITVHPDASLELKYFHQRDVFSNDPHTSTLQGQFVDYSATFEHVSGLGDPRISLLESVEIHEMNRMIYAQGTKDDGAPDFLVNDVPDVLDFPDTVHYSDGGTDLVTTLQTTTITGTLSPTNLTVQLDAAAGAGWWYIRVPDPGAGNYQLDRVVRSDGRELSLDYNAWATDRTFVGFGLRPIYENILHLADCDTTGSYTLHYVPAPNPDIDPPTSNVLPLPPFVKPNFPVSWTGTDNRGVAAYDIFVATDGGGFTLWLEGTRETGAIFPGIDGTEYAFYSVAIDAAGNREEQLAPDTITTVSGQNQAPVIANIPNGNVAEGSTFRWQVAAGDPDGPSADLIYSISSDVGGVVINPNSALISWVTGETDGGRVANVTVTVTDIGEPPLAANESFTITVADVNTPPTLPGIAAQRIDYGAPFTLPLSATDPDVPVQTLTFSLPQAPGGMGIDPATGTIRWTPAGDSENRNHAVTVRVTDDGAGTASSERHFSIYVVGPPRPPIPGLDLLSTDQGFALTVPVAQLLANDTDPQGGRLQFVAADSGSPGGGTITSDGTSITYTPAADFLGCDSFNYIVRNESDLNAVGEILILIDDPNARFGFDSIGRTPSGHIRLTAVAQSVGTYGIRRGDNLLDWQDFGYATTDANGDLEFFDLDLSGYRRSFYQLVKNPAPPAPFLVSITTDAGSDSVLFANVPAGTQTVEFTTDGGASWIPLGSFTTNPNGFLEAVDSSPAGPRNYRVALP